MLYNVLQVVNSGDCLHYRENIMNTLAIYTALLAQNLSVTAFDSDKNTITFDRVTTSEILAISNTLNAMLHANEILLIDSLKFKIRFI
jgi:hypothetical protein